MKESDTPTKFLWIDLEMTGLNPERQRIIEVAALITDERLETLAEFQAVIHQPDSVLKAAEQWPRENMQALFDEVRQSTQTEDKVVGQLRQLIVEHFEQERAVLAGNSIHQDRRFIRQWWPQIDELLHYRMLDVSTLKLWIQATQTQEYEKSETHRAMDDIQESIAEFKWSLDQLSSR